MLSLGQMGIYSKAGNEGGPSKLIINSNHTYNFEWFRYWDVGPVDDTVVHNGSWMVKDDTLILNSFQTPDNYSSIAIKEEHIDSGNIQFIITSQDTIPFLFIAPKQIRINEKYFQLPNVSSEKFVKLTLPYLDINYFVVDGYPLYFPKSKTSNRFIISIKEITTEKFEYSGATFFINQKFAIRGDTLFKLWNDSIQITYLKRE